MTRINCGVLPQDLSRQHLLAEHREIVRIPNVIANGKAKIENIPSTFRLGKGHVKFFYDKIGYLRRRYEDIHKECLARGFDVQNYISAFNRITDKKLLNDYEPSINDIEIVYERLVEREPDNRLYAKTLSILRALKQA